MEVFLLSFRVGDDLNHGDDAWVVIVKDSRIDGSMA